MPLCHIPSPALNIYCTSTPHFHPQSVLKRQSLDYRTSFQPKPPFGISAIFTVQQTLTGPSSALYSPLTCSAMDHRLSESAVDAYSSLAISAAGPKTPRSPNRHIGITETIHHGEALKEYTMTSFSGHSLHGPRTKPSSWYCCRCGDGPQNITLQPQCIACHHVKCNNCRNA